MQLPCKKIASDVHNLPMKYWDNRGLALFKLRYDERTQKVQKDLVSLCILLDMCTSSNFQHCSLMKESLLLRACLKCLSSLLAGEEC